jgi:hypothetical protein
MPDLVERIYVHSRRKTLKGIFVHLDNTNHCNSRQFYECIEEFRASRVPHLADSPDLFPSNLFLFDYLKIKLAGLMIQGRDELISTTLQSLDEILRERLILLIFDRKRLKWVIKKKEDYFHL